MSINIHDHKERIIKWTRRIFKIALWFFGGLAFVLFILSFLGGNGDSYKAGIESALSQTTRHRVEIGKLVNTGFYPRLGAELEDVRLYSFGEDASDIAVAGIEKVTFYLGFWDIMFSNGYMRVFDLQGGYAKAGVFTHQALDLDYLSMDLQAAQVKGRGKLGDKDVYLDIPLEITGSPPTQEGRPDFSQPIVLRIGELEISGKLDVGLFGSKWHELEASLNDEPVLRGEMVLSGEDLSALQVDGDFKTAGNEAHIKADLLVNFKSDPPNISGLIEHDKDISQTEIDQALALSRYIQSLFFPQGDVDIDVEITALEPAEAAVP